MGNISTLRLPCALLRMLASHALRLMAGSTLLVWQLPCWLCLLQGASSSRNPAWPCWLCLLRGASSSRACAWPCCCLLCLSLLSLPSIIRPGIAGFLKRQRPTGGARGRHDAPHLPLHSGLLELSSCLSLTLEGGVCSLLLVPILRRCAQDRPLLAPNCRNSSVQSECTGLRMHGLAPNLALCKTLR